MTTGSTNMFMRFIEVEISQVLTIFELKIFYKFKTIDQLAFLSPQKYRDSGAYFTTINRHKFDRHFYNQHQDGLFDVA